MCITFWKGRAGTKLPIAVDAHRRTGINILQNHMKFTHYISAALVFFLIKFCKDNDVSSSAKGGKPAAVYSSSY